MPNESSCWGTRVFLLCFLNLTPRHFQKSFEAFLETNYFSWYITHCRFFKTLKQNLLFKNFQCYGSIFLLDYYTATSFYFTETVMRFCHIYSTFLIRKYGLMPQPIDLLYFQIASCWREIEDNDVHRPSFKVSLNVMSCWNNITTKTPLKKDNGDLLESFLTSCLTIGN